MRIAQVAVHTLRETVRDRVFVVTLLFALLMIGGSVAVSPLAAGQQDRVIKNVGLASISVIGTLLAVFVGASLVHRETQRRTIYTLLARPLGRGEYLIGKYVGVVLTLALNVSIMALFFGLLVHFHLRSLTFDHLAAIYLIGVELAVLAAFSILFSVLSSPVLSAIFTLSLFFVGHLSADVVRFTEMLPPGLFRSLARTAGQILPNLEYFNAKGMAVYGKAVTPDLVLWATAYAAGYIATAVGIAALLFRRKDLK